MIQQPVPPDVAEIAETLRRRAPDYFPAVGGRWEVNCIRQSARSNSKVFAFRLRGESGERSVIVKIPHAPGPRKPEEAEADRPRVTPRSNTRDKGLHEYSALCQIHEHFSRAGDSRFDAVHPLELLPGQVIVMEKGPDENLNTYLRRANRLQRPFMRYPLTEALNRAGGWLRQFHSLSPQDHCRERTASRSVFESDCRRIVEFLVDELGGPRELHRQLSRLLAVSARLLPRELPLGITHGDFAPRNLLSHPDGRLAGFDTSASWRAPIYEDLGHFLVALKASGRQVGSRGAMYSKSLLQRLETCFLQGYFEDDPPVGRVRLFECQRLLEWWTSLRFVCREARGLRKAAKQCRALLWQPYVARYLERCLREAEASSD